MIRYGFDEETGIVVSRLGREFAVPSLSRHGGGLKARLVKVAGEHPPLLTQIRWTRKLPLEVKNIHRAFWGLPPERCPCCRAIPMVRRRGSTNGLWGSAVWMGTDQACGWCLSVTGDKLDAKILAERARGRSRGVRVFQNLKRIYEVAREP